MTEKKTASKEKKDNRHLIECGIKGCRKWVSLYNMPPMTTNGTTICEKCAGKMELCPVTGGYYVFGTSTGDHGPEYDGIL